jgi:hypothetical protein
MDFLYARPVEITEESAIDLLIAADLYRLPELLNLCENLLIVFFFLLHFFLFLYSLILLFSQSSIVLWFIWRTVKLM